MCELCMQDPCAWNCPNAGLVREYPICAWCDNPIAETYYYDVYGDAVCADCIDACRRYESED